MLRVLCVLTVIAIVSIPFTANAAHPTIELTASGARKASLDVFINDVTGGGNTSWVSLTVPLTMGKTPLESLSFVLKEGKEVLVCSDVPFKELVEGRATGRFRIDKKLLKKVAIYVTYRAGYGGVTYSLQIPNDETDIE